MREKERKRKGGKNRIQNVGIIECKDIWEQSYLMRAKQPLFTFLSSAISTNPTFPNLKA